MNSLPVSCCRFDHIQIYVHEIKSVEYYKELERCLEELAPHTEKYLKTHEQMEKDVLDSLAEKWEDIIGSNKLVKSLGRAEYSSQKQDLVEQMLVGLGWRVVSELNRDNLRTVQVKTEDSIGARFLITGYDQNVADGDSLPYSSHASYQEFMKSHGNRPGVAVLSFDLTPKNMETTEGTNITNLYKNYQKLHPELLKSKIIQEDDLTLFEAYAYYAKGGTSGDTGTVLRFVERPRDCTVFLPALTSLDHSFDPTSSSLCFDHWVSNVHDRQSFLDTLADVLGFISKIDFNAGVVAAGKAKIESTVTGNTPPYKEEFSLSSEVHEATEKNEQVFLPINNALSEYGHVYEFLQELGQGVQHIASKVTDLALLMKRVNLYRDVTGRGFRSLRIPRIYYGSFTESFFEKFVPHIDVTVLKKGLVDAGLLDQHGIMELKLDSKELSSLVEKLFPELEKVMVPELVSSIRRCRYSNVYNLVGDDFDENTYLSIVTSQILVDKQGNDALLQIFTANILQEEPNHEAPFLEFIQRKCFTKCEVQEGNKKLIQYKKPKPGCGGFGIRNFLTLFLSIEVSKAMDNLARLEQNDPLVSFYEACIKLFTRQLNESNPILNEITMTMEQEAAELLNPTPDTTKLAQLSALKAEKNKELQDLSQGFAESFEKLEAEHKN